MITGGNKTLDRQIVELGCPLLTAIAELVWSVTILTQGALDCRTHPGGPHPGGPSAEWSQFFSRNT